MSHSKKRLGTFAVAAAGAALLVSVLAVAPVLARSAITTLRTAPIVAPKKNDSPETKPPTLDDLEKRVEDLENRLTTLEQYVYHGAADACTNVHTNLATVATGFKCKTSMGAYYERVSSQGFDQAWKGPTGLIWDTATDYGTLEDAKKKCASLHGKLPTKDDYQEGFDTGFTEVVPPAQNENIWTATPDSSYPYTQNGKTCYDVTEWMVVPNQKGTGELNPYSKVTKSSAMYGCPPPPNYNYFRCVRQSAGNDYVGTKSMQPLKAMPRLKIVPKKTY